MLTIEVTNKKLEQQLIQREQATDKIVQQVAEVLLAEAFSQLNTLSFARLDPIKHGRPLQFNVNPLTENAPAFGHVEDLTEFADELRKNIFKR